MIIKFSLKKLIALKHTQKTPYPMPPPNLQQI